MFCKNFFLQSTSQFSLVDIVPSTFILCLQSEHKMNAWKCCQMLRVFYSSIFIIIYFLETNKRKNTREERVFTRIELNSCWQTLLFFLIPSTSVTSHIIIILFFSFIQRAFPFFLDNIFQEVNFSFLTYYSNSAWTMSRDVPRKKYICDFFSCHGKPLHFTIYLLESLISSTAHCCEHN